MRYIGYNRIIASDIPLPGAIAIEHIEGPVDIRISLDRTMTTPPGMSDVLYHRTPDALYFSPPGIALYRCAVDGHIKVAPVAGVDERRVIELLIATALPALLWMQDSFVLHAAGVVLSGRDQVLAIAGPSGIGKSSLLAQLLARGATMVADDTLAIAFDGDTPVASGLHGGYFDAAPADCPRVLHPVPAERARRCAALGAIVIVTRDHNRKEVEFDRLGAVPAIARLIHNRHRPAVPTLLERQGKVLATCSLLSRTVPIYDWQRRNDGALLEEAEFGALMQCRQRGDP